MIAGIESNPYRFVLTCFAICTNDAHILEHCETPSNSVSH